VRVGASDVLELAGHAKAANGSIRSLSFE
jgi:hypothetical protein